MEHGNGLTITELSTFIVAIATIIYTIGTFFLWQSSRKSNKIISKQLELFNKQLQTQISSNYSLSRHAVVNRHKEIFFEILNNGLLRSIYTRGTENEQIRLIENTLGSILINHAHSIYLDFMTHVADSKDFESFKRDFTEMMKIPFVKQRWEAVESFHPEDFKNFVNSVIEKKV